MILTMPPPKNKNIESKEISRLSASRPYIMPINKQKNKKIKLILPALSIPALTLSSLL
jgi:hypothetical protein